MRFVFNMIDRRRVWKTLPDYPVYSPPISYGRGWNFGLGGKIPSRKQIKENYEYFLRHKADRLKYLADYLVPFSVELRLEADALPALGRWLYRYGRHLHPGGAEVISARNYYDPAWVGEYRGLNVMNDFAIFAGDYIVTKNKNARWDAWYGDGKRYSYEMMGFGQPCIFGLKHPGGYVGYQGHHSTLEQIYRCCGAGRERWRDGISPPQPWDKPGEFERLLNYLGDANAPEPIPFSQLMMDESN
jgi:hypothetical protein